MTERERSIAVGGASRIAPRLWMGPRPPTGTAVADAGFDLLILCAKELFPGQPKLLYPRVQVIYCPLDDTDAGMSFGEQGIVRLWGNAIADRVLNESRILVTCNQGRNRSGVVCAAAVARLFEIPGVDAVAWVKRQRDPALPIGQAALTNPHFVRFLREAFPSRRAAVSL